MKNTPSIEVIAFKSSGKYYSSNKMCLKSEHYTYCSASQANKSKEEYDRQTMANFKSTQKLKEDIQKNTAVAIQYSGLTCGFKGSYYYVVRVFFLNDEGGFCFYHIDNTEALPEVA
jgi:hypothetical protein